MDSSDVSRERSKLNVMDVAVNDVTARRMRTTGLLLMRVVLSLIVRDLSTSERTLDDGGHLRSWREGSVAAGVSGACRSVGGGQKVGRFVGRKKRAVSSPAVTA